ncbi:hypothetical protein [Streptomyces sp. KL116D]|uniref:hypothetical protein n=1 Tax=Streptomyces sp. KL116D TaxID=3045152 RepID=UPI00355724A2
MSAYPRRQVLGTAAVVAAATALPWGTAGPAAAAQTGAPGRPVPRVTGAPSPPPVPVPLDAHFDNDGIDTADARAAASTAAAHLPPARNCPPDGSKSTACPMVPDVLGGREEQHLSRSASASNRPEPLPLGPVPRRRQLRRRRSGQATVHYADGSTAGAGLSAPDWRAGSGAAGASFRYRDDGTKDARVGIGVSEIALERDPQKAVAPLPCTEAGPRRGEQDGPASFALSCSRPPRAGPSPCATPGSTFPLLEETGAQSVEATVINAGTVAVLASDALTVGVDVPGARTVEPARDVGSPRGAGQGPRRHPAAGAASPPAPSRTARSSPPPTRQPGGHRGTEADARRARLPADRGPALRTPERPTGSTRPSSASSSHWGAYSRARLGAPSAPSTPRVVLEPDAGPEQR